MKSPARDAKARFLRRSLACAALCLAACADPLPTVTALSPDPNPMPRTDPLWTPQPHRDRPRAICVSPDRRKAWVPMPGVEDAPGRDVAVVDLQTRKVLRRVHLAPSPWSCAVDPSGSYVLVTQRYADHVAVLSAETDEEVARIAVPFYTETALWSADGKRVFLANRWKDSVLWWDVDLSRGFEVVRSNYQGLPADAAMGTPVGDNPGPMALSSDGKRLFVGTVAGCTIAVLDAVSGQAIDIDGDPTTTTVGAPKGISRLDFHSPVGGLAVHGDYLFISDIGAGLGAQPDQGIDIDENGTPGDGTANQAFQDAQNELGVVHTGSLRQVHRYTSDSTCCGDFRDVDPTRPAYGQTLPEADRWWPEAVQYLPPKDTWIVAGALPEALAVRGDELWVAFAGSNEVQGFAIGGDGTLTPLQTAANTFKTGYNPKALAVGPGQSLISVDRLAESLTFIKWTQPGEPPLTEHLVVGDVAGGPFPATDAELGEGINEMTAVFSIDGDQTCVACHRDNGAIARPFVMPLQSSRAWSLRNIMAQRGLFDTRPWFFESAMNEDNFFPVLNEFARKENFCCEEADQNVWSKYPKLDKCQADPSLAGCNHVLHCTDDPPPECAARPYAKSGHNLRGDFIKAASKKLFGRETTFGDALFKLDAAGNKQPLPMDFSGMTKALGLFMLATPRLLPNPNRWLQLPSAARGQELYKDLAVGCNNCHPLPVTTTALSPTLFSPFNMPVRFPPVISPELRPDGTDAMLVSPAFMATFPLTVQDDAGLHLGATPLRGLWDRPQTRFYHDGRARSLVQALVTPGHAALKPGEKGFNERRGTFDTHGGTSQLDKYQVHDLVNFVLTL